MKKLLFSAAMILAGVSANAQLATGSIAPNFTVTAYQSWLATAGTNNNGSYTLYDYLDQGYTVFLDVSATWCGPCWNYHLSGALEDVYANHGPAGAPGVATATTDDVMVIWIEGDGTTADATMLDGSGTIGNWIEPTTGNQVQFPMANPASALATQINNDYNIAYFPTIYRICPNRIIEEVGQLDAAGLYASVSACPPPASLPTDPALLAYTGTTTSCADFSLSVTLQNNGTSPLTSATISVTGIPSPITYNWTGNLATYGVAQVNLGNVTLTASANATITITSNDGNPSNSTISQALQYISASTTTAVNTVQDFSNPAFPYANWQVVNPDNGITWEYLTAATFSGLMAINTFNYGPGLTGELDHFITQAYNLTGQNTPSLNFKVANRRYDATYFDKLDVSVSTSCDGPWTTIYSKEGTNLATGADVTSSFSPASAADFRQECVNIAAYANSPALFVRFTNDNKYGNNIFIDDISISSTACTNSIDELTETTFTVFPNPATDVVNVIFNGADANYTIAIMDLQGRTISSTNLNNASGSQTVTFSTENVAKGSYIVSVTVTGLTTTKNVVIK
jgi:hypothetical protein